MIFTGLTISPAVDATRPWLVDGFRERQSARPSHFICATLIVVVHVLMIILVGSLNETRSMITRRYHLPKEHD
jgi:thiosulfate reductase cytochrome b subunit